MPKKIILTTDDEYNIINEYVNKNIGIESLCEKYKVGKLKIKDILNRYNTPIKNKGGQIITGDSSIIEKSNIKRYTPSEGKKIVAKCKKTGKLFDDANNLSGILTEYILEEYENTQIPKNTYQRKKYENEHGKKWFEEYFDIIEININKIKKCPYCNWETIDVNNKSGAFQMHLYKNHNKIISEYLIEYPEDNVYFNKFRKNHELSQMGNHVICLICGKKLGYLNDKHLQKHGLTLFDYKLKYPNAPIISNTYKKKLQENYNNGLRNYESEFTTKPQIKIAEHIKSFGVDVKINDKKLLNGIEIDILIPELKIGIEYNGLYYHGEKNGKTRNSHLIKTKLMNDMGYGLIQIFEDEWCNSNTLVLNKISHILNLNTGEKIGGRNCIIKEITPDIKNSFLLSNHIQGPDKSIISIGAYHNEILVAVMTFNGKRNMNGVSNHGEYELTRFATANEYIVSGIAPKLLKNFIKKYNPSKIISFGDARWVLNKDSNLYTKIGFKLSKILQPDYKYFKPSISRNKRLHKFGFGKSSLKRKFPEIYSEEKTESEMMKEMGYDRIWDCGLFKYELICN